MTGITFVSVGHSDFSSTHSGEKPSGRKSQEQVVEKQGQSEVGLVGKFGTRLLLLLAESQEGLVSGNEQGEVVTGAKMEGKSRGGSDEVGHCCSGWG